MRAALSVGNAAFWVADESPALGNFSPESLGGGSVRMLLVVDDPEAAVRPGGKEHGWRPGRVEDPFGHHWEIGRPLIPWLPNASLLR